MRILFLNPPFKGRFSRTSRSPAVTKGGTFYYPIWLAYAAGAAEQAGHQVRLLDAPAVGIEMPQVLERLADFTPQLILVDTSTPSIYSDAAIAGELKQQFPEAFVLLVGTHPSALPEACLELHEGIDAIALAEYDATVCELATALETEQPLADVSGLLLRNSGEFLRTPQRSKIEQLDSLPFVSEVYHRHLNVRDYFFAAASYPMVMIITGRGCPFRCFFCVYPQVFHERRYRARSAENVVAEFEYIQQHLPEVREVGIEDDCFTANPKRVKQICQLLIERKVNLPWYCNVRGDLDYELLCLMKRAGCRLVTVGFESGSQEILDAMHKGEKVERYQQFARDARRAGILVHGCIMVGNPGDTRETLQQSYEFACQIDCDSMQFYPLYVYPGTEAYSWAQQQGYLTTEDYSKWLTEEGLHNCTLSTPELSGAEMVELCDHYLTKYHTRPKYLLRKGLQALRHPAEGYRSLKSAKTLFSKLFSGQLGKGAC
jgi:radical SAM superfamily enzyme YgiQ (UPF0313 family)